MSHRMAGMGRVAAILSAMAALAMLAVPPSATAGQPTLEGTVLTDAAGRRVSTAEPYQRIISLYGAHTENIFAMDGGSQTIGVSPNDDWPPDVKAKPVFSYHDGLEKFLGARPDLVLIRPMIDRGYGQLMKRLEAHGITVVSLQPTTIDETLQYWMILGALTGRQAQAGQMVARFNAATRRIKLRTVAIEPKKRVYFEAIHDRMRTFAPGAMAIFVLETAGGINLAQDATPRRNTNIADYGKERILSHAREIDVFLAQVGPMNRPTKAIIKAEPGFGLIRAVSQDQIFFIDEKLVSRPTMRLLTGICNIGRLLYPDLFIDTADDASGCPPHSNE